MPVSSYEDLKVWQAGMDLVVRTYRLSHRLPTSERFGLISQMQRAAVSIPANIAEAHGRKHLGDKLRFLSIANGSLKEVETEVKIARRLGFVNETDAGAFVATSQGLGRMMAGLIRSLRRRARLPATCHLPTAN